MIMEFCRRAAWLRDLWPTSGAVKEVCCAVATAAPSTGYRVIAIAIGSCPTLIGGRTLLVAVRIGITVPKSP